MTRIAIIPARGGSKRIPRKNIRPVNQKPLIAHTIEMVVGSGVFQEVMVSTDDHEIAEVAKKHGASVPFMRSPEASSDSATTAAVIQEVLNSYKATGREFSEFCCIYPASILVAKERLQEAAERMASPSINGITSVQRYHHPPQRALRITEGRLSMVAPENMLKRTQDLEPLYHDAGQFYFGRVEAFLLNPTLWPENLTSVVLSDFEAQDLDTEEDWAVLEWKTAWRNLKSREQHGL